MCCWKIISININRHRSQKKNGQVRVELTSWRFRITAAKSWNENWKCYIFRYKCEQNIGRSLFLNPRTTKTPSHARSTELLITRQSRCSIFFSKWKKLSPELRINDRRIDWETSVKYLGMVFDRGLSWCKHIHYAYDKTPGAYIKHKPSFTEGRLSNYTNFRGFKAVIKSQLTYLLPTCGGLSPPSNQANRTNFHAYT